MDDCNMCATGCCKEIKDSYNALYKAFNDVIIKNRRYCEALQKCNPYEYDMDENHAPRCLFCNELFEYRHTDDCEYVILTTQANKKSPG